jgi:ribosomal protein S18 acetylase RimI-like enzyme
MTAINYVIRDALETDLDACLSLDASYSTDYVWKMNLAAEADSLTVRFQRERLPRTVEAASPADADQLTFALRSDIGFVVAADKENPEFIIGYLIVGYDALHAIGRVQGLLVSRLYRQLGIGTRLLGVARKWAAEQGAAQLVVETRTKNYPAITFLQNRGFTFCGFNDQYYRDQDIAIFFGQGLR